MLLAVDLVVGAGCEVGVGRRVLGLYGVAEVVQGGVGGYGCGWQELRGGADAWLYVEQLAHLLADGFVEVEEELPIGQEEGSEVVLVILKEG